MRIVLESIVVDGVRYDFSMPVKEWLANHRFLNNNLRRRGE